MTTDPSSSDRAHKGRIDGVLELVHVVVLCEVVLLLWGERLRAEGLDGAVALLLLGASLAIVVVVVRAMSKLRHAAGPLGRERTAGIALRAAGLALTALGTALAVHGCWAGTALFVAVALALHLLAYAALFLGARL